MASAYTEPTVRNVVPDNYDNDGRDDKRGRELSDEELGKLSFSKSVKPVFEKTTKGLVTAVAVMDSTRTERDSKGHEYCAYYLQVAVTVGDQTTTDNYGGWRFYPKEGRFWSGEKSDGARLKKLVDDKLGRDSSPTEIKTALMGASVLVKSEKRNFQDKETIKNVITAIV